MKTSIKHAKHVAIAAALFSAATFTPTLAFAQVSLDKVVAVVAGEPITQKDVNERVKVNQALAKRAGQNPTPAQLNEYSRDEMINEYLMLNRAKSAGVNISNENVNQAISEMAAGNKMSLEQFQQRVTKEGGANAWEVLQKDVRNELSINALMQKEVGSKIKEPTDKEVKAEIERVSAIEGNPFTPQEVAISAHIFVKGNNAASLKKIKALKARLDKGEAFDAVAKSSSDNKESAANGGMVPYIALKDPALDAGVAKVAAEQPLNTVSEPVKTDNGYHVFKIFERKSIAPTDEEKKAMAKNALMANREKEAMEAWYKELDATRASLVEIK